MERKFCKLFYAGDGYWINVKSLRNLEKMGGDTEDFNAYVNYICEKVGFCSYNNKEVF